MVKILQNFSLKSCGIFFSVLSAAGSFLTHYAVSYSNYGLLVTARFIYGIALESLYVVSGVATEKWFEPSEVTLMSGLSRVEIRIVNSVMVYVLPYLYVSFNSFTAPMLELEISGLILVVCSLAFYAVETQLEKKQSQRQIDEDLLEGDDVQRQGFELTELSETEGAQEGAEKPLEEKKMAPFGFKHVRLVPSLSWYCITFMGFAGATILNFTGIGVDLISKRYSVDYLTAKNYMTIFPSTCLFFTVFFLILLNKYGYKSHSYILASVLCLISLGTMVLLPSDQPSFLLVLSIIELSIAMAFYVATSAASVILAAPTKASSIVVAFMAMSFNLPMFFITPLMGVLSDKRTPEAYQNCLYLLIFFAALMLLSSLLVYFTDIKQANRLLQRRADDPWLAEYKDSLNRKVDRILSLE